jgi:hypothetical protein
MSPHIVTIEQAAFVIPLRHEMLVRFTYWVEWDPDSQEVRTRLLGEEVLGEVGADA